MTFPTYRLPPQVEEGMRGGPTWSNVIQESVSGQEQRVQVWAKCRGRWEIGYSIQNYEDQASDFQAVLALFMAHRGSLRGFPFKAHGDDTLTNERIGTGDGSTLAFQITKTYDPGAILGVSTLYTYVRDIYLPRSGLIVKVDGVTKTLTSDYSISSTGLITFVSAPANLKAITVTGEFDIPVRFDLGADEPLPLTINTMGVAQIDTFAVRELVGISELA